MDGVKSQEDEQCRATGTGTGYGDDDDEMMMKVESCPTLERASALQYARGTQAARQRPGSSSQAGRQAGWLQADEASPTAVT